MANLHRHHLLAGDHRREAPTDLEEFAVRPGLGDASALEHEDLVGVPDGREPVCDRDARDVNRRTTRGGIPQAR
jgi:hypothetical protein